MKKSTILRVSALAFSALALGIAGCGKKEEPVAIDKTPESDSVVLFTWEEYLDPEVAAKFEEETGVKLEIVHYDSSEQMKALLQSNPGDYDVVVSDGFMAAELIELKLVQPLNKSTLPNLANIDDAYLGMGFDSGNQFSVPYVWGTTLIAYRNDKIIDPVNSWGLLWDSSFKGKIAMMDDKDDVFSATLSYLGYSPDSENEAEIREAKAKLLEQIDLVSPKYVDLEIAKGMLATGEVWAALCYNSEGILLEENENISFLLPQEGGPVWFDNFVISRDSKNVQNAHKFIDFLMQAEVAAQNANFLWVATPNKAAEGFLDEELLADETIYPEKTSGDMGIPTAQRDLIRNAGMKAIRDKLRTSVALEESLEED